MIKECVCFTGVAMPQGVCGSHYIILKVDSQNEIVELLEGNNVLSTRVYIKCPGGEINISTCSFTKAPGQKQ